MTRTEFEHLVQQLSRRLYGFAFRILRNQEEAEDVVQEIFIKLWNMGERTSEYKSIEAVAATMTKNHCIDLIRKRKNFDTNDFNNRDYPHLTSPSPHEEMENSESGRILDIIIAALPEIYRVVIRLRDIEGFSYEEIALKTGQNINTLRVTLSRARKLIRDDYNKYHHERRGIKQADRKIL
jgi:RNA polymerase sigma-70 factor, ECF subfamily